MPRLRFLLLFVFIGLTTMLPAQTTAPKAGPEVKKLHAFVGHWTYEGEYKSGPLGPGSKVTGEQNCRMILGGSFLEYKWTEKTDAGEGQGLEIDWYDPINKNYPGHGYESDATNYSLIYTVTGNTWKWTGKIVAKGKQYQWRGSAVFADDLMSFQLKGDLSEDGTTWTPWLEQRYTKEKPAAKK